MATSQAEVGTIIEQFIRREFRIIDGTAPGIREAHLFESGYVDSAGVVELIAFVLDDRGDARGHSRIRARA
jgi:hypothetical protein